MSLRRGKVLERGLLLAGKGNGGGRGRKGRGGGEEREEIGEKRRKEQGLLGEETKMIDCRKE